MLVVGLTGGIGSGKSTVAELFAQRGVTIIDTDQIARDITQPNQPAFQDIVAYFGSSILTSDNTIHRRTLRNIVFNNEEKRIWLEKLLHPLIREKIKNQIDTAISPYCIVVIPLLIENLPHPHINRILVVDTSTHTQLTRSKARDSANQIEIESIIKAQINREKRLEFADDVIDNTGNTAALIPQVEKLHAFYLTLSEPK